MNCPDLIMANFMENSISLQNINENKKKAYP